MDELQAKKVLDALAKKMGCDSVVIYSSYSLNGARSHSLMFAKNSFKFSVFIDDIFNFNDNEHKYWREFKFDDSSFCSILKKLEKHKIYVTAPLINVNQYSIYSIEQLMIDLEIEGYLFCKS